MFGLLLVVGIAVVATPVAVLDVEKKIPRLTGPNMPIHIITFQAKISS